MKESVSNALRWVSLPFVFVGVFTLAHIVVMLLNSYSISSITYGGGPLPLFASLLITFFAGFAAAGVSVFACSGVAPTNKRVVVWVTGILCAVICIAGIVLRVITHESGMDLLRTIVDNVGSIIGAIVAMKKSLEEEY